MWIERALRIASGSGSWGWPSVVLRRAKYNARDRLLAVGRMGEGRELRDARPASRTHAATLPGFHGAVLVVAGTNSGVGKTTVACGLMAACARRGLIVQPFKVGPDFLDGMHHEAAIRATSVLAEGDGRSGCPRKSINLDGWMMEPCAPGAFTDAESPGAAERPPPGEMGDIVRETFLRHAAGADVCIIEGVMGLYDAQNGTTDHGSTAQIAKYLDCTVLLVIDAGAMARSVAAMALGYQMFDPDVRLEALIANNVGGETHIQWIRDAIDQQNRRRGEPALLFAGGLPKDNLAAVPERHLGLKMPGESSPDDNRQRYRRLASLIDDSLDLDEVLTLARRRRTTSCVPRPLPPPPAATCRVAVAMDEAFCFYYHDNLHLLRLAGAEVVYFSPLHDPHLPAAVDAIYIGGGYPELHASVLEANASMRRDIHSFVHADGVVYAECGGLMYLTRGIWPAADRPMYAMCNVFDTIQARMTPHMKMHYATVTFTAQCRDVFPAQQQCRAQKFHFAEIVAVEDDDDDAVAPSPSSLDPPRPLHVQPETVLSVPAEGAGHVRRHCVASFYHVHFAGNAKLVDHLVRSASRLSPHRKQFAISFVSAATEMAFALGLEAALAGVTSLCDFPTEARSSPRRIVCRSFLDAGSMSSEEVEEAMQAMRRRPREEDADGPGVWRLDHRALEEIAPRVVFVQNTCQVCDASQDDVLLALQRAGLLQRVQIVEVAPTTLEGMLAAIRSVAEALGDAKRGRELAVSLAKRLERIQGEIGAQPDTPPPRVLSLEGLAPPCSGGGWLPDMKAAAGCIDALGDVGGAPARRLTWREIANCDPDALVLSPCSASPERTLKELHLLASEELFWSLRCVQQGELYILDHGRFARPGPRLVSGVELLANLFRGVEAPLALRQEWAQEVLKYDCNVSEAAGGPKHCTTELASRFVPVFPRDGPIRRSWTRPGDAEDSDRRETEQGLYRHEVTRCTIPGHPAPTARSAHCMVALDGDTDRPSLLVLAGEDKHGDRLNDAWKLHLPTPSSPQPQDLAPARHLFTWEWLRCGRVADEDVPTVRSNSAAVRCGRHLLVFGGWGRDNVTPLDAGELLHLDTLCWTHCSTRGTATPPPRGNPTMVHSKRHGSVLLFGGWNRKERLSDLWCLDLTTWTWQQVRRPPSPQSRWPGRRTDHTAVLWEREGGESMIVYGGSADGSGSCSELWMLHCGGTIDEWAWERIEVSGESPMGRTGHTACILGRGESASMLIVGGTNALRGCSKTGIVADAWLLEDLSGRTGGPKWRMLPWSGPAVARGRHTMCCTGSTVTVWGGYDGETVADDRICCWSASLEGLGLGIVDGTTIGKPTKIDKASTATNTLQDRWTAEIPIRESDLPTDELAKAKKSTLPDALYKAVHRYAVSLGRHTYIDPASGYSVFTGVYLKQRPCCGNGCRHCPHGHVNVPKKANSDDDAASHGLSDLEW